MDCTVRRVGVVGGGTAGYLTALALRRWFPDLEISVVESSRIPVIGVGEATTPALVAFLHYVLDIDVAGLFREVRPTWKLGIRFDWGRPGGFNYPFTGGCLPEAYAYGGDMDLASLGSLLMAGSRGPVVRCDGGARGAAVLPDVPFAYHLDNARFVGFLRREVERSRVTILDWEVIAGIPRAGRAGEPEIDHLAMAGGELEFDFYVDCTGFRSALLGGALKSRFLDWSSSLPCDGAVVADVPNDGTVRPYTLAQTMDSGWCWGIPMRELDHRGYVYASAFASADVVVQEVRTMSPGMGEPRRVAFRSGRHEHFWRGNVAAVGNAYGFVEPLESTAIQMIVHHASAVVRLLNAERGFMPDHADEVNKQMARAWDYLRWFLAIHYRFNGRKDTPFWRECRSSVDISGIEAIVDDFVSEGLLSQRLVAAPDGLFGREGIDTLLLGQEVPTAAAVEPALPRVAWERRSAEMARYAGRAMSHAEGLDLVLAYPDLLRHVLELEGGWCRQLASRMTP